MAHCLFPLSIWLADEEKTKNYLERQKVRKLRSNSFSISSDLSWKVKERKKNPSFPRDIRKTWHDLRQSAPVSGSMEVSREFARNPLCLSRLWGSNRKLTPGPLAYITRSPTPWMYQWVVSHNSFRLCCNCCEIESVFAGVGEVYHIPRSLKLVFIHFIEDFLQHKVRSFF